MKNTDKSKPNKYITGEFVFTLVLFATALVCFFMSFNLWNEMDAPKLASAAAVPFIVSIIWAVLSLYLIIRFIIKGERDETEKVFSTRLLITLGAVILYCLAIYLGINFYLVSGLFLFGLISYLGNSHISESKSTLIYYAKNILISGVTMLAIFLLFEILFGIKF